MAALNARESIADPTFGASAKFDGSGASPQRRGLAWLESLNQSAEGTIFDIDMQGIWRYWPCLFHNMTTHFTAMLPFLPPIFLFS